MAEASELKEYVENVTRCSICLEDLVNPKSLPCLHTFCLRCLEGYCGDKQLEDEVKCPVCRSFFKIPQHGLVALQRNFFLDRLRELKNVSQQLARSVACEACEDECVDTSTSTIPPATTYCVDCRQRLCERCSMPHRRIRTAAHRVVPLNQDVQSEVLASQAAPCRRHVEEREKLYCFDCLDNICLMCFAVDHQQHKCQEIDTAAKSFRSQLATVIDKISAQIIKVRELLVKSEATKDEFLNEVNSLQNVIERRGEEIKRTVDSYVQAAIQQLKSVKIENKKIIDSDKDRFQLCLVALESFNAYSLELQNKGRSEDVTRVANDLFRRASELQNTAEMTAYEAPRISVTPVACDVEKCISKLVGHIVTHKCTGKLQSFLWRFTNMFYDYDYDYDYNTTPTTTTTTTLLLYKLLCILQSESYQYPVKDLCLNFNTLPIAYHNCIFISYFT